ncbi:MFS transporter, partial [Acinetobacter nematophilus]
PKTSLYTDQHYQLADKKADSDVDIQPVPVVKADTNSSVEIKGQVIEQYSSGWLYFAIVVDNLASGLACAAFIAFLSSLTIVSF